MIASDYIKIIPKNLYVCEYKKYPNTIKIGEFDVPLPVKPPKEEFKNYGLPKDSQIFKREFVPQDLKKWEKSYQKKFIDAMYHKRKHGEWWLIGGREIYLTGSAWTFFNFWHIEAGGLPKFRYEAVEFFLFFDMCFWDSNCLGVLDFKARRLGDTEKALFLGWDIATRYQNSHFGMQNKKKDDAVANFKRIVKANKNMIWFFRPISGGMDNPKNQLVFEYPTDFLTAKRMRQEKKTGIDEEENFTTVKALESMVDFEPTTLGAYDGQRLTYFHGDEWGKTTEINVASQWGIIKPTLTLDNGERIVGKAMVTTTVEEFDEGDISTVEVMRKVWQESDPAKRDKNGQTQSGLYRIFRSALYGAKVDKFGFTDDEATKLRLKNYEDSLLKSGALDDLSSFKRKYPLTIEDVFSVAPKQCVLYPEKLSLRLNQLRENLDWRNLPIDENGEQVAPQAVYGNLMWKDNRFGGDVVWLPSPNGKWCISQHPVSPNVRTRTERGLQKPINDHLFTFGCDPYDSTAAKGSDGAGVVYRRLDKDLDGRLMNAEWDIPEAQTPYMQTDQFVCDYMAREADPETFFEDMLMTSIYYSVAMLCERDKPSCELFFERKGFKEYLKNRPRETKTDYKGQSKPNDKETGIKASKPIINLYVDALKIHVYYRIINSHHPRLLSDFLQFNVKNRTERDLTVAAGMSLLSNMDERTKKQIEDFKNFDSPIFRLYDR